MKKYAPFLLAGLSTIPLTFAPGAEAAVVYCQSAMAPFSDDLSLDGDVLTQSSGGPTCGTHMSGADIFTEPGTQQETLWSGSATSAVDLRTGEVKVSSTTITSPLGYGGAAAYAYYYETLNFSVSGGPGSEVTFSFDIDGSIGPIGSTYITIDITGFGHREFANLAFRDSNWYMVPETDYELTSGWSWTTDPSTGWINELDATFDVSLFSGLTTPVYLQVVADAAYNADFGNTIGTSIQTSPGVTYTSSSGVFLSGLPDVIAVSEPITGLLFGTGLLGLGMVRRLREQVL